MGSSPLAAFERAFPSDLRDGAGIAFDKFGLKASARLEYRNVARLGAAPQKGLVIVQDPDTGGFGTLDFDQLPVAVPGNASVTNAKLGPAPAKTLKGNPASVEAQPTDLYGADVRDIIGANQPNGVAALDSAGRVLGDAGVLLVKETGQSATIPVPDALANLRSDARAVGVRPDGAAGNGTAVDATAFAAMLTRMAARSVGDGAFIPNGIYRLNQKLTLTLTANQAVSLASIVRHGIRLLFTNPQSCGVRIVLKDQSGVSPMLCQAFSAMNLTILSSWLQSDITLTDDTGNLLKIAGVGLEITNEATAGGVLASPLPAIQLDNVAVHNTWNDTADYNNGASGWAIHFRIFGVNMVKSNHLNAFNMMPGSIGMVIDTDAGHPSFLHKHIGLDFNGSYYRGVLIGKAENDVPLQGISLVAPTLVSGGPGSIGVEAFAKQYAVGYIGDDIEIIGGHFNNVVGNVHLVGWRGARIDTYCLMNAGGFGVQAENCGGPLTVKGQYNLQGNGTARAVVLADCSTDSDAGFDIDILYNRASQPPIALIGTTNNVKMRGLGQCSAFVPLFTDMGTSTPRRVYADYVCNGVPVRGDFASRVGISANTTLGEGHIGRDIVLQAAATVTLPSAAAYPGGTIQLENRSGVGCNIVGSGIATAEQPFANGEIMRVQSADGEWSIVSRSNRLGSVSK